MSGFPTVQDKNFLDTFGYVGFNLPEFFNYDLFRADVCRASSLLKKCSWSEIVKEKKSFIVPAYAEQSALASDFMVNWLDGKLSSLLGNNYIYVGSDASIFFAAGSVWHRDLAWRLPVLKVNIYLDFNSMDHSCDFLLISGSHHIDSAYSGLLQKALAWPDMPAHDGGLAESGFFSKGSDPADPCYSKQVDHVPSASIKVTPGKAVIFNTAAIHAVKSAIKIGSPRRLITFIFCTNPCDISLSHFSRDPQGLNLSNDTLLDEIYIWKAMEGVRYDLFDYGEALKEHNNYILKHGLDWDRVKYLSNDLSKKLKKEDGSHDSYQMQKMSEFLTKNIPKIDGSLVSNV